MRTNTAGCSSPRNSFTDSGANVSGARTSNWVAGATGTALPFAVTSAADAGSYTVAITNSFGTVTSAPATLAVGASW